MTGKKLIAMLSFLLVSMQVVFSQAAFTFGGGEVEQRLRTDVFTLASDEMQGRESGTEGEELAARFIQSRMQEIGLQPLFNGSFIQEFEFYGSWTLGEDNLLMINEQEFVLQKDFFVLPNASNATVHAEAVYVGFGLEPDRFADDVEHGPVEGKILFMEYFLPEELDDRSVPQTAEVIRNKVDRAESLGARGVIFVNTRSWRNDPSTRLSQNLGSAGIPVLFARSEVLEYWQQSGENSMVLLSVEKDRPVFTSMNVAGYIDNQARYTVVVGGHFDHLGVGRAGSRSPGSNQIHPGADDNASGVAGVLETARYIAQSGLTNFNYIFIAFGAEEKGLLGSRHFVDSDAYDMGKINYMFNFDMIGRKTNGSLTLIGTGTSPVWNDLIDRLERPGLNITKSASGMGGSDHTSFYMKNIPVIFFFTGIHDDYHRPSDTPEKINFEGMQQILSFGYDMIAELNGMDRLAFSETPLTRRGAQRRSEGVTLGLMPDHAFDGPGLKVLAVVEDRPAQRAGIRAGDIILQIGDDEISDIQTYMTALSNLKANQTVVVVIIREGSTQRLEFNL